MEAAFGRLASTHPVRTVIDVGASDGRWSMSARRHFPNASFLLIEAQSNPHEAALERLSERVPNSHYVLAAAGNQPGTVHFDASDAFSGAASEQPFEQNDLVVPMTTVDAEVDRLGLQAPFLLKLDTHGFEVPIFEGAPRTLAHTSLIVVEAYNFVLRPGSLRFHELCSYLEERGFRPIDLVDVMRRPGDGALWQVDLFFAPHGDPVFASSQYA